MVYPVAEEAKVAVSFGERNKNLTNSDEAAALLYFSDRLRSWWFSSAQFRPLSPFSPPVAVFRP